MPPPNTSRRFSLFGFGDSFKEGEISTSDRLKKSEDMAPLLKIQMDKGVYRPGDAVWVTVELENPCYLKNEEDSNAGNSGHSLLVESLSFELKGMEKLDTQWFTTQNPLSESRQRRGEYVFLDCSNIINSSPIRLFLQGPLKSETRIPLQIWVSQKGSGLLTEESQSNGIVPPQTLQMDIYWKEMKGNSDWVRANETYDGLEEGYESSRDEISSVSSYNPARESMHKFSLSSLSLHSSSSRILNRETLQAEADELLYNSSDDILLSNKPLANLSNYQSDYSKSFSGDDNGDDVRVPPPLLALESVASEAFIRGRSYNIRLDDQVLLRFSPKKSDSNYYFSDTVIFISAILH
ncbi:hypothetical protein Ancab_029942 [Ancistrocladus abbreviatus]